MANTIKKFTLGTYEYGFIEGTSGHIITVDDLIHYVGNDDPEELRTGWGDRDFEKISLADIKAQAVDVKWQDFVRYWGIKSRIASNYHLLQSSMKEIGADTTGMPKWGEDE